MFLDFVDAWIHGSRHSVFPLSSLHLLLSCLSVIRFTWLEYYMKFASLFCAIVSELPSTSYLKLITLSRVALSLSLPEVEVRLRIMRGLIFFFGLPGAIRRWCFERCIVIIAFQFVINVVVAWDTDARGNWWSTLLISILTAIARQSCDTILAWTLTCRLIANSTRRTDWVAFTRFACLSMSHRFVHVAEVSLLTVVTSTSCCVVSAVGTDSSRLFTWQFVEFHVEPAPSSVKIAIASWMYERRRKEKRWWWKKKEDKVCV